MLELIQPSEKCIVTGSSSRGGRRTLLSRTRGRPSAAGATARRLSGASNHGGLHRGNRLRRTQPMQAVALAPLGDPDLKQLDATGGLLRRRPPPVRSGSGKDQLTTRADRCDDGGRVHRLDARHCRRHRTRQMRRRLVLHLSLEAAGAIVPRSDLTIYLYRLLLHERSESVRPRTDSMAFRETEPEGSARLRYALAPSRARTRELRGPGMAQTVSSVSLPYQSRTPHAQATGAPCFAKHVCGLPRNFHTERTPLKRRRAFNSTSTRMCDKRYLLAPFLSPPGAG